MAGDLSFSAPRLPKGKEVAETVMVKPRQLPRKEEVWSFKAPLPKITLLAQMGTSAVPSVSLGQPNRDESLTFPEQDEIRVGMEKSMDTFTYVPKLSVPGGHVNTEMGPTPQLVVALPPGLEDPFTYPLPGVPPSERTAI